MAFLESPRFPDRIAYGSSMGPNYRTVTLQFSSGRTKSLQKWQYPLSSFNISYGLKTQEDMYELLEYFHAVAGMANQFRIRDHTDFRSGSDQTINGTYTNLDEQIGVGDDSTTVFQLIKTYTVGTLSRTRIITKPVSGEVVIALDGVGQGAGWTVDITNGEVTFAVAPTAGQVITAGFEYDVPAMFTTDQLDLNLNNFEIQGTSIVVREIRV